MAHRRPRGAATPRQARAPTACPRSIPSKVAGPPDPPALAGAASRASSKPGSRAGFSNSAGPVPARRPRRCKLAYLPPVRARRRPPPAPRHRRTAPWPSSIARRPPHPRSPASHPGPSGRPEGSTPPGNSRSADPGTRQARVTARRRPVPAHAGSRSGPRGRHASPRADSGSPQSAPSATAPRGTSSSPPAANPATLIAWHPMPADTP